MSRRPPSDEVLRTRCAQYSAAVVQHGSYQLAAAALGVSAKTMFHWMAKGKRLGIKPVALVDRRRATLTNTHLCVAFDANCAWCQTGRAFFLLVRAQRAVQDSLLRHDIEDCLLRWPVPVGEVQDPGDPVDAVASVVPALPSPGLGSERKITADELCLTAGSMPAMVPVVV